jgi:hypothetical protein
MGLTGSTSKIFRKYLSSQFCALSLILYYSDSLTGDFNTKVIKKKPQFEHLTKTTNVHSSKKFWGQQLGEILQYANRMLSEKI